MIFSGKKLTNFEAALKSIPSMSLLGSTQSVWPVKSCQMSVKIAQKWCHKKNLKFLTPLQKLPKKKGDLGKLFVGKGFKKLPKVQ